MEKHQQQLIELVVGKVLNKYDVTPSTSLTKNEKSKIKEVVGNIQTEVEKYLTNQQKTLSERDFPKQETVTPTQQSPKTPSNRKVFKDENNIHQAKTFVNKRQM